MRIKVTSSTDGIYHVDTSLKTIIAWERKFGLKASTATLGMEDLAFLAYQASKEQGIVVPLTFDDFIAGIDDVDVVADESANPSRAAVTPEP